MNNINNNRLLPHCPLTPDTVISTIINRQSELSSLLDTINTRLDSNDRKGSYIKKKKNWPL